MKLFIFFLVAAIVAIVIYLLIKLAKNYDFKANLKIYSGRLFHKNLPFNDVIKWKIADFKAYFHYEEGTLKTIHLIASDNAAAFIKPNYVTCYDKAGNYIPNAQFVALYNNVSINFSFWEEELRKELGLL